MQAEGLPHPPGPQDLAHCLGAYGALPRTPRCVRCESTRHVASSAFRSAFAHWRVAPVLKSSTSILLVWTQPQAGSLLYFGRGAVRPFRRASRSRSRLAQGPEPGRRASRTYPVRRQSVVPCILPHRASARLSACSDADTHRVSRTSTLYKERSGELLTPQRPVRHSLGDVGGCGGRATANLHSSVDSAGG